MTNAEARFNKSHIRKVYACLAVTCHLHFWQNDRDFLRATVVTRGWNGYRNKSQHRKSTLEKKILPPFQQGFEPATFQSRVRRSNHWAIPAPNARNVGQMLYIAQKCKSCMTFLNQPDEWSSSFSLCSEIFYLAWSDILFGLQCLWHTFRLLNKREEWGDLFLCCMAVGTAYLPSLQSCRVR